MNQICINLPPPEVDHTIDLEVTIDGLKRLTQYRVESFDWMAGGPAHQRIDRLKGFIEGYERGWELVQIGTPSGTLVPIMFRQRY